MIFAKLKIQPSPDELNDLFSLANKVPFDDRVNHNADIADLNINGLGHAAYEEASDFYQRVYDFLKT